MEDGGAIHHSEVTGDIAGDDDAPALDSKDLAALQEDFRAQEERLWPEKREDDNVTLVSEDWRLSQFWYDSDTAETVACEVLNIVAGSPEAHVACIACATLYSYLKSQDCLEKIAQAMNLLAETRASRFLLLTGEVQKDRAAALLEVQPCVFRPKHSSKLGNEFRLFTNYDPGGDWEDGSKTSKQKQQQFTAVDACVRTGVFYQFTKVV